MRATSVARAGILLALCVLVAGCSRKPPQIMHTQRGQTTPDEFAILPSKPMVIPEDMSRLPPPTPGQPNRTDVNPMADAVIAFGGNPARIVQDGKIGSDGALIRQTTRYGVDPQIRPVLAVEDLEFRKRKRGRLLERWLKVPTYYNAYEREEMNQHAAQQLYLRSGVPSSAPPPDPTAE